MPSLLARSGLRASEWLLAAFYAYVCVLVPFFPDRPQLRWQPFLILAGALILFFALARAEHAAQRSGHRAALHINRLRDWIPLPLTLLAFREMGLFVRSHYDVRYELAWIHLDRIVLLQWHLRSLVESLGPLIPFYLELCYFFVYGAGAYCLVV